MCALRTKSALITTSPLLLPPGGKTQKVSKKKGERWKDAEIPTFVAFNFIAPPLEGPPPFEKRDANDDDDDAFGGISSSRESDELNNPRRVEKKREIFFVTLRASSS